MIGWPSVTRPSRPVWGEEKATSDTVSVFRTQRAWWISPPKHTSTPMPAASALAATLTASTRLAGPVRPRRRGGPDRAGEHDGGLGVVEKVAQHGRLLERVGAVGDHHSRPAAGRVAGFAADLELVLEREVRARLVHHGPALDALEGGQPGHRRHEALAVEGGHRRAALGRFEVLRFHGDGSPGREDHDPAGVRHVGGRAHEPPTITAVPGLSGMGWLRAGARLRGRPGPAVRPPAAPRTRRRGSRAAARGGRAEGDRGSRAERRRSSTGRAG